MGGFFPEKNKTTRHTERATRLAEEEARRREKERKRKEAKEAAERRARAAAGSRTTPGPSGLLANIGGASGLNALHRS